ncbi:hypothetical protein LTR17_013950 [Elasticomyces elasticus]|nr:hypothetical protein LTR17_013950 [Elasticomyces elasticus]
MGKSLAKHPLVNYKKCKEGAPVPPAAFPEKLDKRPLADAAHIHGLRHCQLYLVVIGLRTYGLKIHYDITAIGHVNRKDKHTLKYKNIAFTMDEFRMMVHQLIEDSRQALLEDRLFVARSDELPAIPWAALHDNSGNRGLGWS